MVRRHLIRAAGLAVGLLVAAALALPAAASAVNARVNIFDYQWSTKEVHINLGEKVTWDWLGPDLAHSVTGMSANDLQWDSDPGTDAPDHQPGDEYTLQFEQPGVYYFQCKLHAFVRGEVVVSDVPGEPDSLLPPRPPLNIDLTRPTLGGVRVLGKASRGPRGVGMRAAIDAKGKLDAEYYRLNHKGQRVYNGYKVWPTFIGINRVRLGARWKHFRARPGRYVAVLRATDTSQNVSKPVTKAFTVAGSE